MGRLPRRAFCASGMFVLLSICTNVAIADESPLAPTDINTTFERGNQSYLHGDFKGALDAYEAVLAAGVVHEDLYYALGNAYFKADRLGPAILNYERAISLTPDDEDALTNLRLARQTAAERWQDKLVGVEADPLWMRALGYFTPGGLTLAFLALYGGLFLLVLLIWIAPRGFVRVTATTLLIFVVLGALAAGGLLAGRWWLASRAEFGFVIADEVQVKEGPDSSAETSFVVHAGMRARSISHDADWVKLRLSNGLEGWVRERDFARL